MKCARPACLNREHRKRLCEKHYAAASHGHCDIAAAQHHVTRLLARYDILALAALTGISESTLRSIKYGRHPRCQVDIWTKIVSTSVPTRPQPGVGVLPAIGTRRRIRALSRMGWSQTFLAEALGEKPAEVTRICRLPGVTSRRAAMIADLFDELHMTPGPCRVTAQRSRTKGWLAPLDWEPETIDDPDAQPIQPGKPCSDELYVYFRDLHMTDAQIAAELGVQLESLQQRRYRASLRLHSEAS